jgi:hypothetical protein
VRVVQAAAIGEKIVKLDFDVITFFHNQFEVRGVQFGDCLVLARASTVVLVANIVT